MAGRFKVVNLSCEGEGVIRCDRSSVLGNPFEMRNEDERAAVIEAFRRYLWLTMSHGFKPVQAAEADTYGYASVLFPIRCSAVAFPSLRRWNRRPDR